MRTALTFLCALAVTAHSLPAQGLFNKDRRFSFIDENDTFGSHSDSAYTQGLHFRWDFASWPNGKPSRFEKLFGYASLLCVLPSGGRDVVAGEVEVADDEDADSAAAPIDSAAMNWCKDRRPKTGCDARLVRSKRPCGIVTFILGQTEYTPNNLLNPNRDST